MVNKGYLRSISTCWRLTWGLVGLLSVLDAHPTVAQNDTGDMSIDVLSPEVPLPFHQSDIVTMTGGGVHIPRALLGLPDTAHLDAFSYGKDILIPFGPEFHVALEYSTWRRAVGAGGAITRQVGIDGAAGDKFRLFITRSGRTVGPILYSNAPSHGLTPIPPGPESNIDVLSLPPGIDQPPFFFSITDTLTISSMTFGPADIIVVDTLGRPPRLYRSADSLGLLPGDNIDALAISDQATVGVFDATDIIFVSLRLGSPSRALYFAPGAGDGVVQMNPRQNPPLPVLPGGPNALNLPGAPLILPGQLDLSSAPLQRDELDAMTALDPGPCRELTELPPDTLVDEAVRRCERWLGGEAEETDTWWIFALGALLLSLLVLVLLLLRRARS